MNIQNFWQKHYPKVVPILTLALLVLIGHFLFPKTKSEEQKAPSALNAPSEQDKILKEQVGQMLILGFRGTKFQKNSFIDKAINELKIGGVILFDYDAPSGIAARNIVSLEQVKNLTADLQKNSGIPLFISANIKGNLGEQLKNSGVNFNFASVVTLNKDTMICDVLSTEKEIIEMVQAGCGLIIISNNASSYDEFLPQRVIDTILKAVSAGTIAASSIEASYNKVIKLKKDFGIIE